MEYFMTLKISRSQVSTQPNPTHQKFKKNSDPMNPTQTMDGPNPWPTLRVTAVFTSYHRQGGSDAIGCVRLSVTL